MISAHGVNSNDEWGTPKKAIYKVIEVLGYIDLDPASSREANERIKAIRFYSKDNNGLKFDWYGKVFLNPPYSRALQHKFLTAAVDNFSAGRVEEMIILTNSGTDTIWNQIISHGLQAYTIGRLNFLYSDGYPAGSPSRGQVFTYFGPNKDIFIEVFTKDKFCWIPNITLKHSKY